MFTMSLNRHSLAAFAQLLATTPPPVRRRSRRQRPAARHGDRHPTPRQQAPAKLSLTRQEYDALIARARSEGRAEGIRRAKAAQQTNRDKIIRDANAEFEAVGGQESLGVSRVDYINSQLVTANGGELPWASTPENKAKPAAENWLLSGIRPDGSNADGTPAVVLADESTIIV